MTTTQAAELFTATGLHFGLFNAERRVSAWRAVLERATTPAARATALQRVAFWREVAAAIALRVPPRAGA